MAERPLFESWWKPWRWTGSNWFVAVLVWFVGNLYGLAILRVIFLDE